MKIMVFVFAVGIIWLLSTVTVAFSEDKSDFRDATWGMNKHEVINSETTGIPQSFLDNDNELNYEVTVFGCRFSVKYHFEDGVLVEGSMDAMCNVQNQLLDVLKNKYGIPEKQVVGAGPGTLTTYEWETDTTVIRNGYMVGHFCFISFHNSV